MKALTRARVYSSRSDRIPRTCKPVEMAVHPGGSLGDGGGSICGRVHSRHSNPRSLRRASSCASSRERLYDVQILFTISLRTRQSWRWTSSFHRAM
eukprot:6045237-Prymnesium_polylepis.1